MSPDSDRYPWGEDETIQPLPVDFTVTDLVQRVTQLLVSRTNEYARHIVITFSPACFQLWRDNGEPTFSNPMNETVVVDEDAWLIESDCDKIWIEEWDEESDPVHETVTYLPTFAATDSQAEIYRTFRDEAMSSEDAAEAVKRLH